MPMVQLPQGDLRDEIRIPLYDTVTIASGDPASGVRSFFQNIMGKNKAETNMTQATFLPQAVSYRIQGLALDAQYFGQFDAANVGNPDFLPIVLERSSLRLRVGEKDYWEGPMLFLAGRMHEQSALATGGADPLRRYYQRFGELAVQPVIFQGKHVVDIIPMQNFVVEWVCQGLTTNEIARTNLVQDTRVRFLFSFKGLMRRPVQ